MTDAELLAQLAADVRWIRLYFERRERPSVLLSELQRAYGSSPFTVRQVFLDAERAPPSFREALGDLDAVALGRALAKLEGHGVQRMKRERGSLLWVCEEV